jgi:hypothetical protein
VDLGKRGGRDRRLIEVREDVGQGTSGARSMRRLMIGKDRGGTASWRRDRTSMYSSGMRSGREPMSCPSLIRSPWRLTATW